MPESASFSVRKKPNYRRRRTLAVLGLLVAVVVVLLVLPRGGGTGRPAGQETPKIVFVRTASVVGLKTPDQAARQAEVDAITKMITDFYQEAFVDPEKWGDGTFEDLKKLFTEEAQPAFMKEIAALTIGEGRTQLKFVDPDRTSTLKVSVFFDAKGAPMYATAGVNFSGRGTLKQTGPALLIKQTASFYMQRNGDSWVISSFDADQTQETPTSPSPSPSAS
jgi:hypothetical protein